VQEVARVLNPRSEVCVVGIGDFLAKLCNAALVVTCPHLAMPGCLSAHVWIPEGALKDNGTFVAGFLAGMRGFEWLWVVQVLPRWSGCITPVVGTTFPCYRRGM
jgi:hypothetical protein